MMEPLSAYVIVSTMFSLMVGLLIVNSVHYKMPFRINFKVVFAFITAATLFILSVPGADATWFVFAICAWFVLTSLPISDRMRRIGGRALLASSLVSLIIVRPSLPLFLGLAFFVGLIILAVLRIKTARLKRENRLQAATLFSGGIPVMVTPPSPEKDKPLIIKAFVDAVVTQKTEGHVAKVRVNGRTYLLKANVSLSDLYILYTMITLHNGRHSGPSSPIEVFLGGPPRIHTVIAYVLTVYYQSSNDDERAKGMQHLLGGTRAKMPDIKLID